MEELTFEELKERVALQLDEISILELLEITSEDLVDRFSDLIELNYPKVLEALDEGI